MSVWWPPASWSCNCIAGEWSITTDRSAIRQIFPPGNGLLLWFEVDDIDAAIIRAEALGAEILTPCQRNPPDGEGGPNHWEIWLRDPDGYKVILASPDGTADGDWRP
mgnify:CR=1 FL=1